jgi:hypothetical protein
MKPLRALPIALALCAVLCLAGMAGAVQTVLDFDLASTAGPNMELVLFGCGLMALAGYSRKRLKK